MNREFQQTVLDYYYANSRAMPWRDDPSFYAVLVSELMLQQTQVSRVMVKFLEFMARFPTIEALAGASLSDVLESWQGLGYNRRAKYLYEAARQVARDGVPQDSDQLVRLPGIGRNTAGAIMNYVYNMPTPFIETNIRSVYLHHFFSRAVDVSDREIMEKVDDTLPDEAMGIDARTWFWALMDYGAYLKAQGSNHLSSSRHYRKQGPLKGSVRELRGRIIAVLIKGPLTADGLRQAVMADDRFEAALRGLERDGLITCTNGRFHLTN